MSRQNGLVSGGFLVIVVAMLGSGAVSFGAQRNVPGSYPTIQAAIDAAADGDQVVLAAGTYTGSGNRDLNFEGKTVLVRSTDPQDPAVVAATVLNCLGSAGSPHRAATLNCASAVDEAGLAGLTITGAHDSEGAVVCDLYSWPVVRNCVIHTNTGSGIYVRPYAAPWISDCRIEGNVVDSDGGGICLALESRPTIEGCVIRGNNAAFGGGIYCYEGWPDILDSEISGNHAATGGGVCWQDSGVLLENCTVAGNSAQVGGGAFGLSDVYQDRTSLDNCIVWGNRAGDGRQVTLAVGPFNSDTDALTVAHSLVQGGQQAIAVPAGWRVEWPAGNLQASADPLFVLANGADGKWETWQDNDYHLASGSPCIDAGDPAGNHAGQMDAAGLVRLVGSRVDLGAYEATSYTQKVLVGDTNGDSHVDMLDLLNMAAAFGRSKGVQGYVAACDFNGDNLVDMTDLLLMSGDFGK